MCEVILKSRLLNHPAPQPHAGVARGLRLQVVSLLVEDDGLAHDGGGAGLDGQ